MIKATLLAFSSGELSILWALSRTKGNQLRFTSQLTIAGAFVLLERGFVMRMHNKFRLTAKGKMISKALFGSGNVGRGVWLPEENK